MQSDQIALWNSYLFLISVNVWAIFSLRNRQQITFVMLNRFCPLSKKPPSFPVFNRQYQAGWNTNQKQMKNTHTFCIVFHVLKIVPPDLLFLVAYIRFYISRYHFHNFLELHSILSEKKKIFGTNFPFLMDSLKSPSPQTLN